MPLIIPSSKFLIPVEAKGDVTTFGPSMADVFPDIPERYTRNLMDPQLRKHLEEAADKLAEMLSGNVTRLNANPPYMEMTAMLNKEKNVLLAHLVNYNVTVDGDITPAQDAEVQVILPAGKTAKSVKFSGTLLEMKPLEFASKNDGAREKITFTADEVKVYGLAVVELE
jgi:hypothetical protein